MMISNRQKDWCYYIVLKQETLGLCVYIISVATDILYILHCSNLLHYSSYIIIISLCMLCGFGKVELKYLSCMAIICTYHIKWFKCCCSIVLSSSYIQLIETLWIKYILLILSRPPLCILGLLHILHECLLIRILYHNHHYAYEYIDNKTTIDLWIQH